MRSHDIPAEFEELLSRQGRRVLAGTHPLCGALADPRRRFLVADDLIDRARAARLRRTLEAELIDTLEPIERPIPPEMIPQNLFDRLFGVKNQSWVGRKKSVLDLVKEDAGDLQRTLGVEDKRRLDEHLTSVRDLERAVASLPPDYGKNLKEPESLSDLTDYPRIAKIQSDLLVHAFASGQTRAASYMLTKCQSLTRFPWLGLGGNRHHDYTHNMAGSPQQQRTMRDICRWHVEEFSYFLQRLRAVPEGEGNLLDNTACVFVHEHAEANSHKCNGLAMLVAGGGIRGGTHTKTHNGIGDVYLTIAEEILKTKLAFPTAREKMTVLI